jgi:hypothetical protein
LSFRSTALGQNQSTVSQLPSQLPGIFQTVRCEKYIR